MGNNQDMILALTPSTTKINYKINPPFWFGRKDISSWPVSVGYSRAARRSHGRKQGLRNCGRESSHQSQLEGEMQHSRRSWLCPANSSRMLPRKESRPCHGKERWRIYSHGPRSQPRSELENHRSRQPRPLQSPRRSARGRGPRKFDDYLLWSEVLGKGRIVKSRRKK